LREELREVERGEEVGDEGAVGLAPDDLLVAEPEVHAVEEHVEVGLAEAAAEPPAEGIVVQTGPDNDAAALVVEGEAEVGAGARGEEVGLGAAPEGGVGFGGAAETQPVVELRGGRNREADEESRQEDEAHAYGSTRLSTSGKPRKNSPSTRTNQLTPPVRARFSPKAMRKSTPAMSPS